MKTVVYSIVALLVVANCCVSHYTSYQFVDSIREDTLIPTVKAIGYLASSNTALNGRIERARQAVNTLAEENTRLKASLNEGVEMLKEEIEENNKLNQQIDNLNFHIKTLKETIKTLKEAGNATT